MTWFSEMSFNIFSFVELTLVKIYTQLFPGMLLFCTILGLQSDISILVQIKPNIINMTINSTRAKGENTCVSCGLNL